MADRVLRDHSEPCHHADSRRHPRATGPWKCDLPHCPGGQEVTAIQIVRSVVAVFDANGLNDRSYYDDLVEGVDAALGLV